MADFRNPSMDDFCATYLDRNVGIAITVASHEPTLSQIRRLIQLGSAFVEQKSQGGRTRQRQYLNIYEALIADPAILMRRLLELLPKEPTPSRKFLSVVQSILTLYSQARYIPDSVEDIVKARLAPVFREIKFDSDINYYLGTILDAFPMAQALSDVLGADFESMYSSLSASAAKLTDFDSLTNVCLALDRPAQNADWAERFMEMTPDWLDEPYADLDDLIVNRDMYSKVVEYLALDSDLERTSDWEEMIESAEAEARADAAAREREEEDDWSTEPPSVQEHRIPVDRESQRIDTMFASLRASGS